ncbi:ABC transporter F family member 4-like [Clinocottus analis]|uniref:ABC transporter F family member 4-like n=1 Tax=Clinocottus analis TaxID=304258 RepID=UPI0035C15C25
MASTSDDAEHVQHSGTPEEEPGEGPQTRPHHPDKAQVVPLPTNGDGAGSVQASDGTPVPMGIKEQVDYQEDPCQTSTVGYGDTVAVIEAKVEDEETNQFVEDAMASPDVPEVEVEVSHKVETPAFEPSEEQPQAEGGIEETRMVEINTSEQEERQVVNTPTGMDGRGHSTEESGKAGDAVIRESTGKEEHRGSDLKVLEEKNVQVEEDLPETAPQCVPEVPAGKLQDVELAQVEEAFQHEEGDEGVPDNSGGEATSQEKESTTEHPSELLKGGGTDCGETLREQLKEQAPVEDEKGGGAEEVPQEGEVEMSEEPVTVLDDEIEETEERLRELEEQKPATMTKDQEEKLKLVEEEDETLRDGREEVEEDEEQRDGREEVEKDEEQRDGREEEK